MENAKITELRNKLNDEEKKIFDSIMNHFPSTQPESAYDKSLEGGIKFQYNYN